MVGELGGGMGSKEKREEKRRTSLMAGIWKESRKEAKVLAKSGVPKLPEYTKPASMCLCMHDIPRSRELPPVRHERLRN